LSRIDALKRGTFSAVAIALLSCSVGAAVSEQADSAQGSALTVVRWKDGAPGCDSYFADGTRYRSIAADSLYIAASVQDTGWKMRADVYVRNKGLDRVDVLPEMVSMSVVLPKAKELKYQEPRELAKSLERKAKWRAAFRGIAASLQTQEMTSRSSGSASGYAYDSEGNWVSGSAVGSSTTETTVPDFAAQQRAREQSARDLSSARDAGGYLQAVALKANTLGPWDDVYGAVFFERANNTAVLLRVTLAGVTYEIPFARGAK
jgi:hypothetical protein